MSFTVVVPFRDYTIPVDRARDYLSMYLAIGGFLKINATDYLLINATDKLILGGGDLGQAPSVVVPFRDYTIPVPERLTDGR